METGTDKQKYDYSKVSAWVAKNATVRIEQDLGRAMITSAGVDVFRTSNRFYDRTFAKWQDDFSLGMSALAALTNHLFQSQMHRDYILNQLT